MGLDQRYVELITSTIEQVHGLEFDNLKMLELGDQIIDDKNFHHKRTGKDYFSSLGIDHTSVDINGLHGALIKDLRNPEEFIEWKNVFDVITNAGTTEHVEPIESQYNCWKILHDCLKPNGAAIHVLPDVDEHDINGAWVGHCKHYYSKTFFETLAQECDYEIIFNDVIRGNRCVSYIKNNNNEFTAPRDMFTTLIAIR